MLSPIEITRRIDRILEQLRTEAAAYGREARRFETLADHYWKEICSLHNECDALKARINSLLNDHSRCANVVCQLCQR